MRDFEHYLNECGRNLSKVARLLARAPVHTEVEAVRARAATGNRAVPAWAQARSGDRDGGVSADMCVRLLCRPSSRPATGQTRDGDGGDGGGGEGDDCSRLLSDACAAVKGEVHADSSRLACAPLLDEVEVGRLESQCNELMRASLKAERCFPSARSPRASLSACAC